MTPQTEGDECLRPIIRGLTSTDGGINSKAANSFRTASAFLQAAIVDTLRRALGGQDRDGRAEAAWGLGVIKHAAAIPDLLNALGDPEPTVRHTAALALGNIGHPATAPVLAKLVLEDPEYGVRSGAASALALATYQGMVKNPEASIILIEAALHEPDLWVRIDAANALGRMKDSAAWAGRPGGGELSALLAALRQPNPAIVRFRAAQALGWVGDPETVLEMVEALADPEPEVVLQVALALEKIGAPEAAPGLAKALRDPRLEARYGAAVALTRIKVTSAVPDLLEALKKEEDAECRRVICEALCEVAVASDRAARDASAMAAAVSQAVSPALLELRDRDPSVIVRLQAREAMERLGIESMLEPDVVGGDPAVLPSLGAKAYQEVADARKQLHTFCLMGEILEEDRIDTFKIKRMAQQLRARKNLPIRDTTLRDHLKAVKDIFNIHLPDLGLIWDTGQGQRGYALTPQWRVAWRIAMQLLGRNLPDGLVGRASKQLTED